MYDVGGNQLTYNGMAILSQYKWNKLTFLNLCFLIKMQITIVLGGEVANIYPK